MTKHNARYIPWQTPPRRHFGTRPADPVGQGLRSLFAPAANAPLPPALQVLLDAIEANERAADNSRPPHKPD
jgi:hypothetical protein